MTEKREDPELSPLGELRVTDPEFVNIMERFIDRDIIEHTKNVDPHIRTIAVLASLAGLGAKEYFSKTLRSSLGLTISPDSAKEIVYQATAYLGIGRSYPLINALNEAVEGLGLKYDEELRDIVKPEERREAGTKIQVEIFGEAMKDAWKKNDINWLLSANCFGDWYTRKGLTLKEREIVSFMVIASQGGAEPQATAHAKGAIHIGISKELLEEIILACLPYIGYPRTLNALRVVEKASE